MTSPDESAADYIARSLREGAAVRLRVAETMAEDIARVAEAVIACFARGGKLLLFGNGGSAADAQHIATEFTGRYLYDRPPLAAIALTTDTSALTAIGNDYGYDHVFVRQVQALGRPGDVAFAISTSGRSPSIVRAADAAREIGMTVVALTGGDGGTLSPMADVALVVPASFTPHIQECHLAIEHLICEIVEARLFPRG